MILKTKEFTLYNSEGSKAPEYKIFSDLVPLDRNNLICVSARPGMGKTALLLHIALEYAQKFDKTVYIFSIEMSAEQIYKRMLIYLAEVDAYDYVNNCLSEADKIKIKNAAEDLKKLNIIIDDEPFITTREMNERISKIEDIGIVLIDYVNLIQHSVRIDNREQEMAYISRDLSDITKTRNIPIIYTSQLHRQLERRKDKRPTLNDMRFSAVLADDADTVIFIYRDEYYNEQITDTPKKAEITVAKNRFGGTDTLYFTWQRKYVKFKEE